MNIAFLNKFLTFIAPYSIAVSTLYLLGYWGSFKINIFEFIGIGEIIKTSIYQLAQYGGFILVGTVISEVFLTPVMRKAMPPGSGADLPEAKFVKKYWRLFLAAIVAYSLYFALYVDSEIRWFIAAIIMTPVIGVAASRIKLNNEVFASELTRSAIVYPLAVVLFFSYGWGTLDASMKKKLENEIEVNGELKQLVYIGRTSSHVFFWVPKDKAVSIVAESEIMSLKFTITENKPTLKAFIEAREKSNDELNK